MPLVNVMVNSRAYTIACDAGEEEHLKELAAHVDGKVKELIGTVGQVGDQKLLLMAAVLITDEFFEVRSRLDGQAKQVGELSTAQAEAGQRANQAEDSAAAQLEAAAARLEKIVQRLQAA